MPSPLKRADSLPSPQMSKNRKSSERRPKDARTQETVQTEESKDPTKQRGQRTPEQTTRAKFESLVNRLTSVTIMRNGQISDPCVTLDELTELCLRVREQFMKEPVLIRVLPDICIFADIHGQYADFLPMLRMTGFPPKRKMMFLGDYVDRGNYSIETLTLLLAWKLLYPSKVYMLRGNHETRAVCRQYGFLEECRQRFGEEQGGKIWTHFNHVFNCMPLAALIGCRIFCTHGGISEDMLTWDQMDRVVRPTDIVDLGLLTDLMWADPSKITKKYELSPRGVSLVFGKDAINEFCGRMKVDLIIRGHQCVDDGYEFFSENKRCLTIFSAPTYCGEVENFAAMVYVSFDLRCQIFQYKSMVKYNADPTLYSAIGSDVKEPEKK